MNIGTPQEILNGVNRVMNVGTIGHIDHGSSLPTFAIGYGIPLRACNCLTKTPTLKYHDPHCHYRIDLENWNEDNTTRKQHDSEAPTQLGS